MRELSNEEIYQEVGTIVNRFEIYQCYECALSVMQWLTDNEIEGKMLELKTRYRDEDYILSDRIGSDESITINGKHYGVEVRGLVFDNLSAEGMTRDDWLKDFHCQSEEFTMTELGL